MLSITTGRNGEIRLPSKLRERYGLAANTPVRVIETRTGVLLVPMTDAPMADELVHELAAWQSLGSETWADFPYCDGDGGTVDGAQP